MELTEEEKEVQESALKYITQRKDELIEVFIARKKPLRVSSFTLFMAGSPGAGKTEFVNRYMSAALDKSNPELIKSLKRARIDPDAVEQLFIKIDVDEIRDFLPQYCRTNVKIGQQGNAHIIQKAANKGLDVLRDYCLKNDISFLHDGTFGNYDTMRKLIRQSLDRAREVKIYYIYLDPIYAWNFTKAREYFEGRNIKKDKFIEQFYNSRENVDRIKEEFSDQVVVHCILKDARNTVQEISFNQRSVADFLKLQYSKGIREYSREELSALLN